MFSCCAIARRRTSSHGKDTHESSHGVCSVLPGVVQAGPRMTEVHQVVRVKVRRHKVRRWKPPLLKVIPKVIQEPLLQDSSAKQEETCCCGASVRSGAITIGCLHVTLGFITASLSFLFLFQLTAEQDRSFAWKFGCYVFGLISVIQIAASLLLIYGAIKGNKGFLAPWILHTYLCEVYSGGAVIYFVVKLYHRDLMALLYVAVTLVVIGVHYYFIVIVLVYHHYLQESLAKRIKSSIP